jgi:MerR family transcriptional regulator/heat shock protein HspR
MLREVQRLSQEEGVNLAGIKRILELQVQVDTLRDQLVRMRRELEQTRAEAGRAAERARPRVFAAGAAGDIVAVAPGERPPRPPASGSALVVWRPQRWWTAALTSHTEASNHLE